MAEPGKSTSNNTDAAIKIVAVGGGLLILSRIVSGLNPGNWFEPGRTDRVRFDYPRTQKVAYWVGKSEKYPDGYYWKDSPWNPEDLANRLHTVMNGLESGEGNLRRSETVYELANLGYERLKWLHNYWLEKIDPEDTLWRWIDQEAMPFDESDEKAMEGLKGA